MKAHKNDNGVLEARKIFVDAGNYSEYELVGYYRLVKAICKRLNKVPADIVVISNIQEILNVLDDRKKKIVRCRYFEGNTLDDIGSSLNISGERVRQIEVAVQERLKFVVFSKEIAGESDSVEVLNLNTRARLALKRAGIETITELIKLPYRDLIAIYGIGQTTIEDIRNKLVAHMVLIESEQKISFEKLPIDTLDFSNRVNNALKSKGIYTIKQLLDLSVEDIYTMRGIGEKSFNEVLDKRHQLAAKYDNNLYEEAVLPLLALDLSSRAMNCLIYIRIKTLDEFMQLTREKVTAVRYIGEKTWQEIYAKQQALQF